MKFRKLSSIGQSLVQETALNMYSKDKSYKEIKSEIYKVGYNIPRKDIKNILRNPDFNLIERNYHW